MKTDRITFYFWFRLKSGRGISVHNAVPLFSERNGSRKVIRVYGIAFEVLS